MKSIETERVKRLIDDETARARAKVGSEARQRVAAYDIAVEILPHVVKARAALHRCYENLGYSKEVSPGAIAKEMKGALGREWGRSTVANQLYRADERIIEHAVLECRTRMTLNALSADFTRETVTHLESKYLDIIGDALDVGHQMRGERQRTRAELVREAREVAIQVAHRQRVRKPISMAARERLWDGFAPFPRRVFET